ncbi:MAG: FAD-binding protein [Porphyromonadaceae bacterium]|nr:MAG: FAD-binding protein [Porphyromonadaceae bacterium]
MSEYDRIGIIFCDPPSGYTPVDLSDLIIFVRDNLKIPVIIDQPRYLFSDFHVLMETIRHHRLTSVILAGIRPERFRQIVRTAMTKLGYQAESVVIADFGDTWCVYESQVQNVYELLERVHSQVVDKRHQSSHIQQDTIVIGAGIAGIQASLEIANAGLKVYLIEKSGTIGGHMAKFDKTFPTLDCAACILTPKMVEVGQHPLIELMTCSEVVAVNGTPGHYKVTVRQSPRWVDVKSCIGCGTCSEKCPVKVSSEFDEGTTMRKAIYMPFPQAVPNKYLIDGEACRFIQEGKCGVCVKVCPVTGCINLYEVPREIEIEAGNIIVANGFKPFQASRIDRFGYGKYPNVLTSLEFERLINAAGPTGGEITFRTTDKKGNSVFVNDSGKPQKIGIIHCVGSRDENFNPYCSKVCCMYSLKLAHLVREKLPSAEIFEYFIDMRAFGKGYEEFYCRIQDEGVRMIRGKTARVDQIDGHLHLRTEDIIAGRMLEQDMDMIILSIGLEPADDQKKLSDILGIDVDEYGWFKAVRYEIDPVRTNRPGIWIAGVCQGPKDIPDSVVQASAAAAGVLQSIMSDRLTDSEVFPLTYMIN